MAQINSFTLFKGKQEHFIKSCLSILCQNVNMIVSDRAAFASVLDCSNSFIPFHYEVQTLMHSPLHAVESISLVPKSMKNNSQMAQMNTLMLFILR